MAYNFKEQNLETIGIIPASGYARRMAPLPFSKELYPIGFGNLGSNKSLRPKPVARYLLEKMSLANVEKAYVIIRRDKWDIPNYFGDGSLFGIKLAYLIMDLPYGVPYTIDQAYPFVREARIVCGFPDILFQPDDTFVQLIVRQVETNADIVLAILPTDRPEKWDMLNLDKNGRIQQFVIKPPHSHLRYTWVVAVWTPVFTNFMHEYLANRKEIEVQNNALSNALQQKELYLGDVFQAAMSNKMHIETVFFQEGSCIDIGTPEDMLRAVKFINNL
jgi:glucose-1-phosphate thymidylyltransferase